MPWHYLTNIPPPLVLFFDSQEWMCRLCASSNHFVYPRASSSSSSSSSVLLCFLSSCPLPSGLFAVHVISSYKHPSAFCSVLFCFVFSSFQIIYLIGFFFWKWTSEFLSFFLFFSFVLVWVTFGLRRFINYNHNYMQNTVYSVVLLLIFALTRQK